MAVQRLLAIRLIEAYESKNLAVPEALSNFEPRSKKTVVPRGFLVSTVKDHTSALSKHGSEIVAESNLLGQFLKASGDEAFSNFAESRPKRAHDEAFSTSRGAGGGGGSSPSSSSSAPVPPENEEGAIQTAD